MSNFKEIASKHYSKVHCNIDKVALYLGTSIYIHDRDKFKDPYMVETYEKHFEKLREIPWGTPEYKEYEKEHFSKAHLMHAQQPHHFNDSRSLYDTPNLMDVIELVADIKASYDEYEPEDKQDINVLVDRIMVRLHERPFTMEDYVRNTLDIMYSRETPTVTEREEELQERIKKALDKQF
jgi:hypothetical protein